MITSGKQLLETNKNLQIWVKVKKKIKGKQIQVCQDEILKSPPQETPSKLQLQLLGYGKQPSNKQQPPLFS